MVEHGWTWLNTVVHRRMHVAQPIRLSIRSIEAVSPRSITLFSLSLFLSLSLRRASCPSGSKWNTLFLYLSSSYGRDYGFETKPSPRYCDGAIRRYCRIAAILRSTLFIIPLLRLQRVRGMGSANLVGDGLSEICSIRFRSVSFRFVRAYLRTVGYEKCLHVQFAIPRFHFRGMKFSWEHDRTL